MRKPILLNLITMLTLASTALALSACASSKPSTGPRRVPGLDTQIEIDAASSQTQRGLELRVLTIDDAGDRLARALSPYESDQGPIDQADRQRWRDWGLRWVMVPVVELDAVLASQKLTQASQVRWMGEFPSWRPVIRTGELRNTPVRVGESSSFATRTLTGRPRLLARVWTTPELTSVGVQALLHMDLGIQIASQNRTTPWQTTPTLPSVLDEGGLMPELTLSLQLDSGYALVLVGEDPSFDWQGLDDLPIIQSTDPTLGPGAPNARTLGEHMFSTPGTGYVGPGVRYVPPKKVLIVLVPKAGGVYRLLAPIARDQGGEQGNAQRGGHP